VPDEKDKLGTGPRADALRGIRSALNPNWSPPTILTRRPKTYEQELPLSNGLTLRKNGSRWYYGSTDQDMKNWKVVDPQEVEKLLKEYGQKKSEGTILAGQSGSAKTESPQSTPKESQPTQVQTNSNGEPFIAVPSLGRAVVAEDVVNMSESEQNTVLKARFGKVEKLPQDRGRQLQKLLDELGYY